jgi:hypothetical protein
MKKLISDFYKVDFEFTINNIAIQAANTLARAVLSMYLVPSTGIEPVFST